MQRRCGLSLPLSILILIAAFTLPRFGDDSADVEAADPDASTHATERSDAPTQEDETTLSDQLFVAGVTSVPAPPVAVDDLTSFDATPPDPNWQKPEMLAPTIDPTYGTSIRRLTTADGTRFDRNTYSRRQAENSDGTRFMTYHGDAAYHVVDRASGELIRALDIHPDAEPQWHPTDPDRIRHILGPNSFVGDLRWYETDVTTGQTTIIADITGRVRTVLPEAEYMKDKAEGSPSADGSRAAWIVFDDDETAIGIVSYDLATDVVLGVAPLEPGAGEDAELGLLDWVSASPTGDYVMAGYWYATIVYDADLTNGRRVNDKADHSDIALSADGRDTYVFIDFSAGVDGGWLVAVDLETLERTRLVDFYDDANTSMHISGKGYDRPGWVVVSTYDCKVPGAWSCDKVMAVDIGATGRIYDLAHTYNCGANYWTETHAVVNRSFTRIYFNSDGGSCGIDAEVYELSVPDV